MGSSGTFPEQRNKGKFIKKLARERNHKSVLHQGNITLQIKCTSADSRGHKNVTPPSFKYEKEALLKIKSNLNIAIINVDKTKQIIIMNKEDYVTEMNEALEEIPCMIIKKDLTNKLLTKLTNFKNSK